MEAEDVRLRLQRLYKLTADEANTLIQSALDSRKKERLLQVRAQSKKIANRVNHKVKNKERSALKELSNTLEEEWKAKQRERLEQAEAEFEEALRLRGEAQRIAEAQNNSKQHSTLDQDLQRKRMDDADRRYQIAVTKLRQERKRAAEENREREKHKSEAIEKERIRAAAVAALGTPESMKPRAEDKTLRNKVSLHNNDVRVKDSFYDQPEHAVIPATSEDNIVDAFQAAAEQAKIVEERLRNENIRHTEAAMKSTLRGEDALRKVRLDNSKATLESNLEVLRRKEFARQNAGSMAATEKRLAMNQATKQFQMEQIVADAIGGRGYSVTPDPELDISSATDSSAVDPPHSIPYTHYDLPQQPEEEQDPEDDDERTLTPEPPTATLPEATQVPSILKTSNHFNIAKETHSVRFNDEQRQLLEMFESQKREMEALLEQAKIEHEENLRQLELAQASTLEGETSGLSASQCSSTSNNSSAVMTQKVIENLDAIKSYQERLIQKYSSGSENNATTSSSISASTSAIPSTNSSAEQPSNINYSIQAHEVNSSDLSNSKQSTSGPNYVGLSPYTPPTFHESMFDATKVSQTSISKREPSKGMIDIEEELRQEQEIIAKNEAELQKLRAISENLERQMMGLTLSSTGPIYQQSQQSIEVKDLPSLSESYHSNASSIKVADAPAASREETLQTPTPPPVTVERLKLDQSGVTDSAPTESTPRSEQRTKMTRKVSKNLSNLSHSSVNETSYISLPDTQPYKFQGFNSSSSSISTISRDSQTQSHGTATLIGISKATDEQPTTTEPSFSNQSILLGVRKHKSDPISTGNAHEAQHSTFSGSYSEGRINDIIRETLQEIMQQEGHDVALGLPSLSVTPVSTVNETPLVPATFAELESISSDNDTKSELPKPDPNEDPDELSETDTEILTKLLMEQFNGLEKDLNAAEIANESYGVITEPVNVLPTSPSSENSGTNSLVHGFAGIDFNVTPGSPVVLSEMELNHLPELSTTVEEDSSYQRTPGDSASPSSSRENN
ncbi:Oidioi.mRNA.OKI2018_I69.chr2.g5315.t1.cds [Oikopleura dioica]|uniref:Oidioi.mRNA.OKI2018_I69.chr2.g5315.t1.cds n=1 Tax=Oikopleura dioica TaxID=34765 RepID=A0ABN7T947_OIKDI|nr:Oidioi.mRNA.OKI2018_I69.chr2.g5315.t1.cds [Oikopleura dioica]